jgi:3-oxoacyl-[acyl-carrier protein] reductase
MTNRSAPDRRSLKSEYHFFHPKEKEMDQANTLTGKNAMVTGGGRGIGYAIARRLGKMGARVAICGRNSQELNNAASRLRVEGIEVFAPVADITHGDQIKALVDEVQRELGSIEILVNNAGIGIFGALQDRTEQDWDSVINTNLKSVFLVSRLVIPEMIRKKSGYIINISSLAGKSTFAGGGIYCASKWGLLGLTGCMAEDLRSYGIRVSAICPGSVATDFSPHTGKDTSKMLQPEDVAYAVAALVTQAPGSFISEVQMRPTQKP